MLFKGDIKRVGGGERESRSKPECFYFESVSRNCMSKCTNVLQVEYA